MTTATLQIRVDRTEGASNLLWRLERRGRRCTSVLEAAELARFVPVDGLELPAAPYVLEDVQTDAGTRNRTPDEALELLATAGRSPLTLEEGLALALHDPEVVAPNAGFSLAGSRCGDRRVLALWISKGAPKLGWCWAGNPHTWLGTASCAGRVAA